MSRVRCWWNSASRSRPWTPPRSASYTETQVGRGWGRLVRTRLCLISPTPCADVFPSRTVSLCRAGPGVAGAPASGHVRPLHRRLLPPIPPRQPQERQYVVVWVVSQTLRPATCPMSVCRLAVPTPWQPQVPFTTRTVAVGVSACARCSHTQPPQPPVILPCLWPLPLTPTAYPYPHLLVPASVEGTDAAPVPSLWLLSSLNFLLCVYRPETAPQAATNTFGTGGEVGCFIHTHMRTHVCPFGPVSLPAPRPLDQTTDILDVHTLHTRNHALVQEPCYRAVRDCQV